MSQLVHSQEPQLTLRQIVELQFSGASQAAHDAYIEFFQHNDPDYNALNLFGICCISLGKLEKAEKIFEHVVQEAPHINEARLYLANCRFDLGKMDQALSALVGQDDCDLEGIEEKIIRAKVYVALDQKKQAKDELSSAMNFNPRKPDELLRIAGLQEIVGNTNDARKLYKKVLFNDPKNCEALLGLAKIASDREEWDAVMMNTKVVLAQKPLSFEAAKLQAKALERLERYDELVHLVKSIAARNPDDVFLVTLLCKSYSLAKDYVSCIFAANHGLKLDPNSKACVILRGTAYFYLGLYETAFQELEKASVQFPGDAEIMKTMAICLERLCRIDEAMSIYERLLEEQPDDIEINYNKAYCHLLKGDLKEGLRLYQMRNSREELLHQYRGEEPIWNGEDIRGKHILVHSEQGFGDTIMACRFIKFLEDQGAKITFAVPRALKSLMDGLKVNAEVIVIGEPIKKVDFHVPLMSLIYLTTDQWNEIPSVPNYLSAPLDVQAKWDSGIGKNNDFCVGLVCSGNPRHANDAARSLNMATLLEALPAGPQYHLLQKDLRDEEAESLLTRKDVSSHHLEIEDFADTAALCMRMDLIISVDTSVAHLAGALGRPTIILLSAWPDWRWGLGRDQDVWYPNTRLLRQSKLNDWQSVLTCLPFIISDKMKRFDSSLSAA